jgi:hypothetical protein
MADIKVGNVVEMYRHYESACGFRAKNGGKWAHRVETRCGGDASLDLSSGGLGLL